MKILKSLKDYAGKSATAVTIGSFDGVHLGHRKVIGDLKKIAQKNHEKTVVISFDPHPRLFFNPEADLKLLTTNEEKARLLADLGVDYLILQKFDRQFANQSPENFVGQLVEALNMKDLLIGYDHHFGKDRQGDFNFIRSLEPKYLFKTHKIEPVIIDGIKVSSTKIREALKSGDISLANKLLGYPYQLSGKVVSGNRIGRQLGFPTANIQPDQSRKLLPKQGVYLVKSVIENQPVYGMMNLGMRPTIDGHKLIMEIHFFDFNRDIYGQRIPIYFLDRLRSEQKFESLEALKEQLQKDAQKSKEKIKKMQP